MNSIEVDGELIAAQKKIDILSNTLDWRTRDSLKVILTTLVRALSDINKR